MLNKYLNYIILLILLGFANSTFGINDDIERKAQLIVEQILKNRTSKNQIRVIDISQLNPDDRVIPRGRPIIDDHVYLNNLENQLIQHNVQNDDAAIIYVLLNGYKINELKPISINSDSPNSELTVDEIDQTYINERIKEEEEAYTEELFSAVQAGLGNLESFLDFDDPALDEARRLCIINIKAYYSLVKAENGGQYQVGEQYVKSVAFGDYFNPQIKTFKDKIIEAGAAANFHIPGQADNKKIALNKYVEAAKQLRGNDFVEGIWQDTEQDRLDENKWNQEVSELALAINDLYSGAHAGHYWSDIDGITSFYSHPEIYDWAWANNGVKLKTWLFDRLSKLKTASDVRIITVHKELPFYVPSSLNVQNNLSTLITEAIEASLAELNDNLIILFNFRVVTPNNPSLTIAYTYVSSGPQVHPYKDLIKGVKYDNELSGLYDIFIALPKYYREFRFLIRPDGQILESVIENKAYPGEELFKTCKLYVHKEIPHNEGWGGMNCIEFACEELSRPDNTIIAPKHWDQMYERHPLQATIMQMQREGMYNTTDLPDGVIDQTCSYLKGKFEECLYRASNNENSEYAIFEPEQVKHEKILLLGDARFYVKYTLNKYLRNFYNYHKLNKWHESIDPTSPAVGMLVVQNIPQEIKDLDLLILDGISLLASAVEADFFVEFIAMSWSAATGRYEQSAEYAMWMAIPGGTILLSKMFIRGYKHGVKFVRKFKYGGTVPSSVWDKTEIALKSDLDAFFSSKNLLNQGKVYNKNVSSGLNGAQEIAEYNSTLGSLTIKEEKFITNTDLIDKNVPEITIHKSDNLPIVISKLDGAAEVMKIAVGLVKKTDGTWGLVRKSEFAGTYLGEKVEVLKSILTGSKINYSHLSDQTLKTLGDLHYSDNIFGSQNTSKISQISREAKIGNQTVTKQEAFLHDLANNSSFRSKMLDNGGQIKPTELDAWTAVAFYSETHRVNINLIDDLVSVLDKPGDLVTKSKLQNVLFHAYTIGPKVSVDILEIGDALKKLSAMHDAQIPGAKSVISSLCHPKKSFSQGAFGQIRFAKSKNWQGISAFESSVDISGTTRRYDVIWQGKQIELKNYSVKVDEVSFTNQISRDSKEINLDIDIPNDIGNKRWYFLNNDLYPNGDIDFRASLQNAFTGNGKYAGKVDIDKIEDAGFDDLEDFLNSNFFNLID